MLTKIELGEKLLPEPMFFGISNIDNFYLPTRLPSIEINFINKSISELKRISKIALLKFIQQLSKFQILIFQAPKVFLTARLKSTLFNDIHNGIFLYA